MFVQPDLTWRILSTSFAFGAISLIVALELRAMPNKGRIESLLVLLAFLSAANFLARPLIVIAIEGPYASSVGFQTSLYWTTALLAHAVMALMIALCLFTAEALDLMRALRSESITDPLSGLLNRRGFETRASTMLGMCQTAGLPASLIIADLDRFKALNDRHGHAAGDRVIAEFAARLRAAAGTRAVAGRLGGEEFAVLLPMADAAAARLFTEAVRNVFSGDSIAGLPREVRVTASFGIALCAGKESLSDLAAPCRRGALSRKARRQGQRARVLPAATGTPVLSNAWRPREDRDQPRLTCCLSAVATGVVTIRYFASSSGWK